MLIQYSTILWYTIRSYLHIHVALKERIMSNETITLSAQKRELTGKKVRTLRAEGQTPAVVHDHGKDSIHITVEEKELKKVFSQAGRHHPVALSIDGKNYNTLIKEVTHKPATTQVYHTVFQAIKANETVKAEVPVKLVGEIPAEKKSLLVLQGIEFVEIEALPKDLIDVIEVDASSLEESGDKLHVSDITVAKNVTILTDAETVVASVETPKDQIAEADAAAEALAADAAGNADISEEPAESSEAEAETKESKE